MDRITEAIAHFIGFFHTTVEQARHRDAYDRFDAEEADIPELPALPTGISPFAAPQEFAGYEPGLEYRGPPHVVLPVEPYVPLEYKPLEIPAFGPATLMHRGAESMAVGAGADAKAVGISQIIHGTIVHPTADPLGSVATYINQGIGLSDNDYFGVGGHGLAFDPAPVDDGKLIELAGKAAQLSPIMNQEMVGSAEELAAFVTKASELLSTVSENLDADADVFVKTEQRIEGPFVNGEEVGEALKLEDYFSLDDEPEKGEEAHPANVQLTEDGSEMNASVTVETGHNVLVNNAVVKNVWTGAPVTAVVGKHIELNAIIQINAWSDNDSVSSALDGWSRDDAPTQAFNIANFERFDPSDKGGEAAEVGDFPKHWVVEEIKGDLMIVSWLEQFSFIRDNDIGVLSASGASARIYSGGNTAYNDISIYELGAAYDLIIIGGNVYDANIIHQLNILVDDDLVGAVSDFETTGEGKIATSSNLLWNQGHIYNVGGADRFEPLPKHYRETAEKLAKGENYLSDGVLSDPAFAGSQALRVLHIDGDLINVQYAKQTNMLGDSDQLALAKHAKDAHPGAEWSVTTGKNALLNNASIVDLDSLGKTYVGGGHYSNDVLVQADIISTEPEFGGQNPDMLVNEAIAFLDDDAMDSREADHEYAGQFDSDDGQADGLQTLIG